MGFSNYKVINKVLITLFTMSHDPEFEPLRAAFQGYLGMEGVKITECREVSSFNHAGS